MMYSVSLVFVEIKFICRGGFVVKHGTRIREISGSIPGVDQSDFFFLLEFPIVTKANAGLEFNFYFRATLGV